ncbi:hypothetical protein [Haliangium sp.]|uniref:hypothetical protein n=1 Tax=Haliangium sp. TaxID=2663208 RepID=UPI003D14886E
MVLEHLFVGGLLRVLWLSGPVSAEVMRPQVDNAGYDLVIEVNDVIRHIQLKSSDRDAKTARQNIHLHLARKPSGCVIWMQFDPESLDLGPFLWFGGLPGEPLPALDDFKVAKHTKGDATGRKAERPMLRVVPKRRFEVIETIEEIVDALFFDGHA